MFKRLPEIYSELTKTSTALPRLAVLSVLSAARRLVLIFVNSLYFLPPILLRLAARQEEHCFRRNGLERLVLCEE